MPIYHHTDPFASIKLPARATLPSYSHYSPRTSLSPRRRGDAVEELRPNQKESNVNSPKREKKRHQEQMTPPRDLNPFDESRSQTYLIDRRRQENNFEEKSQSSNLEQKRPNAPYIESRYSEISEHENYQESDENYPEFKVEEQIKSQTPPQVKIEEIGKKQADAYEERREKKNQFVIGLSESEENVESSSLEDSYF